MAPVIKAQGLGKRYTIGSSADANQTFREMLVQSFTAPVRRLRHLAGQSVDTISHNEEFWALKDVNFEVQQGEVVGIIGRNGAGKSTLLKIMSRITEPTEGRVEIRGRVASLLEVGTGFHPELTGHENIYLNGAILGMSSNEISRKFDEIVDFAEVEKFINTPVKRYSSGMYVRLAFAVAAHLEPEILVVDEVLAVGDAAFQKKCLGKMGDVAKQGRTVLFVSHNMAAVQKLCGRGILLAKGRVEEIGSIEHVIACYLNRLEKGSYKFSEKAIRGRTGDGRARFLQAHLLSKDGKETSILKFGEPGRIRMRVKTLTDEGDCSVAFEIKNASDASLFTSHHTDILPWLKLDKRDHELTVILDPNFLRPGRYVVSLGITDKYWNCLDWIQDALSFDVEDVRDSLELEIDRRPGMLALKLPWEMD